jgi:hypothetical protein
LISNRTCVIVKELLQKSYTPIKIKSDVVTKPLEIVDKVMLFPYMYYFDEVKKQNAYIVQENDAGKIRIILEYPSTKVHPTVIPHGLNIVGFTKTDGATRAYRFPYADYYRPTKR